MRVIAGKYKSRTLTGPKKEGLRPTADRVKEALFNIIGAKIIGADFLDLFAGTGAIGIEALSRGANSVVFADANSSSIKVLSENLKILETTDHVRVIHLPVERTLDLLFKEQLTFDLIFLDPPFQAGLLPKTVFTIANNRLLKTDGILVIEHPQNLVIGNPELTIVQTRNYGDISLTFTQNNCQF